MLVRYFQELAYPAPAVAAALARDPQGWLPTLVTRSSDRGLELIANVGLKVGSRRVEHGVSLTVSEARRLGDTTVIPISWRPAGSSPMIPTLEGDIEIAAIGEGRTQLAISASYRPPLGWMGAVADRALLRRVAEATVKDFLDHVAEGVEQIIAGTEAPASTSPREVETTGPRD